MHDYNYQVDLVETEIVSSSHGVCCVKSATSVEPELGDAIAVRTHNDTNLVFLLAAILSLNADSR